MRIASIRIDSYKSFITSATIEFAPRFSVFIGANNCGKTNILDGVEYLFHPDVELGRLRHHRARIKMTVHLTPVEQKELRVTTPLEYRADGHSVSVAGGGKALSVHAAAMIAGRVKRLQYEDFTDFTLIESDYRQLAERYPRQFELFGVVIRQYFPEIESIERITDAESVARVTLAGPTSVTIERLGSGFRRAFVILLYALHPDYHVVLIDEPEIHLHPGMIKKLRKFLHESAVNQVIVTTHSPLLVDAASLYDVYRVQKDARGSRVFSLRGFPDSVDVKRLVQELNSDNLEMFFADKVLLVEGVSDRILMRGLIDRFYTGPDDVKVIHTNGKSNIDVYVRLMETFNIPCVVMLDRDALSFAVEQVKHGAVGGALFRRHTRNIPAVLEMLKNQNIFILENGTIERNYPKKYQRKDSKPLNALAAAASITEYEFRSPLMKNLREIIARL